MVEERVVMHAPGVPLFLNRPDAPPLNDDADVPSQNGANLTMLFRMDLLRINRHSLALPSKDR